MTKQSFKCIILKSLRKQGSLAGMNEAGLDAMEAESDMGMARYGYGYMLSVVNFSDMTGVWNICHQPYHLHAAQSFK